MNREKVVLRTYTKTEKNMYLTGLAGQNVIYNVIGATLAYYLQFTLLIPAIAVSTIMAIARVWDAFNDPMMGTFVDRTSTKWGKCRPYLMFVPIPILIITVACFLNGFFDPTMGMFEGKNAAIVIWAGVAYVCWGMLYTVGDIPLWGITALMTESEHARTKLLAAARIVSGIAAGICLVALQPLALKIGAMFGDKMGDSARGERMGFIVCATAFALIGTVMFQMTGLFTKEKIRPVIKKNSIKDNFKLMFTNKPFRQTFLSGLLGSPKQLLLLCAMPLVTYYFASKDPGKALLYMIFLGGSVFLGQFVAQAFVPSMLKRWSKKDVYNWCNLICVIPFIMAFGLYLMAPNELTKPIYLSMLCVLFFIGGGGNGITMVIQSLMIADAVDYEEYHSNLRPDGVFFSGQSFVTKLGAGISTIISGIGYSIVGFSDSKVAEVNQYIANGGIPRENPEYSPYLMILFFLVTIPPAVGFLLSVIPTWHYCLSNEEHEKILLELSRRRGENENGTVSKTSVETETAESMSKTSSHNTQLK